jgi:tetratricopeptide (TPR) repeat protein
VRPPFFRVGEAGPGDKPEEAMHGEQDDLPASEAAEYNDAYRRGCDLVKKHMVLHDQQPAPSPAREAELQEGVGLLQRAVTLQPLSWPAWWMLGKGHQARADHQRAYEAFRQATRLWKKNADVPRELCMECLELGKFPEAVEAARLAVRIERSDPGLQANLALALLLAGDVDEALDQAEQAAARNSRDEINRYLLAIIREVKDGRRPQPKTLADVEG